jgi:tRNA(Phe) wybutosine-synthesizing methylase Tyw3
MALSQISSEYRPDQLDDPSSVLPSFYELRRKNLLTLYGEDSAHDDKTIVDRGSRNHQSLPIDKSPKGCVDGPIQKLCDWINSHPSFVTLSSCSGRIAIFDPNTKIDSAPPQHYHHLDDNMEEQHGNSGKGRGEWIFVSHTIIDPKILPSVLTLSTDEDQTTSTLIFKFEPMVLHVAACSLQRGRQLLTLATSLGYRESGLVVTPHRVTVAIRSHSLAWTVPLARQGPLRPPQDYLEALGHEANRHMKQNHRQMQNLEHAIQDALFQKKTFDSGLPDSVRLSTQFTPLQTEGIDVGPPDLPTKAYFRTLPDLNLWGHDVVILPSKDDDTVATILVFGGYGSGPKLETKDSTNHKVARRNSIYCMKYLSQGNFSDWHELSHSTHLSLEGTRKSITSWYGVDVVPSKFLPREGLQACLLPLIPPNTSDGSAIIALWGGRTNPSNPLDELLLYEFHSDSRSERTLSIHSPVNVLGNCPSPSPRWGHTFTALSGKDGMMAILLGGRNENTSSQDTVYILRLLQDSQGNRNFFWNRLDTHVPPQFHHSVTKLLDDTILISSGLMDPKNLTECFISLQSNVGREGDRRSQFTAFRVTSSSLEQISLIQNVPSIPHFAAGLCCFLHQGKVVVAYVGGLPFGLDSIVGQPTEDDWMDTIRWYTIEESSISKIVIPCEAIHTKELTLGTLVHTRCIPVPNSSEFLIFGGGVASFAFGPIYAPYVRKIEI